MLHIANTIVPIFAIIALGWAVRNWNFLPAELIGPLNRLVFYLAIPAMIFREVAGASFGAHFHPLLLVGTTVPVLAVFVLASGAGVLVSIPRRDAGTFLQSAFHGNLGYIGLAVAYYFLGKEGFTSASILAAFLMLLQNFLAILGLQLFSLKNEGGYRAGFVVRRVIGNPVILSALAGIAFSLSRLPLPGAVDRSLSILSGMALPLALLVIGSSLSFGLIRSHVKLALSAGLIKLSLLPAIGFAFYRWFGLSTDEFLPGLVLLASPTATVTYVMAGEMHGSPQLASAAVSISTLLSCVSFILWLSLAG